MILGKIIVLPSKIVLMLQESTHMKYLGNVWNRGYAKELLAIIIIINILSILCTVNLRLREAN